MRFRAALGCLALMCAVGAAHAQRITHAEDYVPPSTAPYLTPTVTIGDGQSWAGGIWHSSTWYGWNPQTQTLLLPRITSGNFPSQVIPVSAGIFLASNIGLSGLIGLTDTMVYPNTAFTLDTANAMDMYRIAVMTRQLLRSKNGMQVVPIINYNKYVPGSDLWNGPEGGLGAATANFSATWSGTVMTVPAMPGGNFITVNEQILDASGNLLGMVVSFVAGTTGGSGSYNMNASLTLGATPMVAMSNSWLSMLRINAAIVAALPSDKMRLNAALFQDVLIEQGGALDGTYASTIAQWTLWHQSYDALNLPGAGTSGMIFYHGIRAPNSSDTECTPVEAAAFDFLQADADGRTVGGSPWYQWKFRGTDGIHTGEDGTIKEGEFYGLAMFITEDELRGTGRKFTPLWLSRTRLVTVTGTTIRIPFDRPAGAEFASSPLQWMSTADDGLEIWPQYGFHVFNGPTEVPLCLDPAIDGFDVILDICQTIPPASGLRWSYAFHGPGGPTPSDRTGVGGNLMVAGPPRMLPGLVGTINSWAYPVERFVP